MSTQANTATVRIQRDLYEALEVAAAAREAKIGRHIDDALRTYLDSSTARGLVVAEVARGDLVLAFREFANALEADKPPPLEPAQFVIRRGTLFAVAPPQPLQPRPPKIPLPATVMTRIQRDVYEALQATAGDESIGKHIGRVLRASLSSPAATAVVLADVASGDLARELRAMADALQQLSPSSVVEAGKLAKPPEQRLPLMDQAEHPKASRTTVVEGGPSEGWTSLFLSSKPVKPPGFVVVGLEMSVRGLGVAGVTACHVVGDTPLVYPSDCIECRTTPLPENARAAHPRTSSIFRFRNQSALLAGNTIKATVQIQCLGPVVYVEVAAIVVPRGGP